MTWLALPETQTWISPDTSGRPPRTVEELGAAVIRRKTTQTLADAYHYMFEGSYYDRSVGAHRGGRKYKLERDELYDFLYENDFDSWFLHLVKSLYIFDKRALKELIMGLHTGTSISSVTTEWTWNQRAEFGQRLIRDMAEDILILGKTREDSLDTQTSSALVRLARELELDGYIFRDNRLYYSEAGVFDAQSEAGIIDKLTRDASLASQDIIRHHLSLSESHYIDGKWDDSISNSRKYLEAVLQEVAAKHHITQHSLAIDQNVYSRPVEVRKYLESVGLVEPKEIETIAKIYSLLSETGSHPYIAQRDQARLMRYLALVIAQFVLLKLNTFLNRK